MSMDCCVVCFRYTESEAAGYLKQVAQGLEYMHKNTVVHCDLKPDNLLFTSTKHDATIKIIDFGFSNIG